MDGWQEARAWRLFEWLVGQEVADPNDLADPQAAARWLMARVDENELPWALRAIHLIARCAYMAGFEDGSSYALSGAPTRQLAN